MGLAACLPRSRPLTPPRDEVAITEVSPTPNGVASPSVWEFLNVFRLKFKLVRLDLKILKNIQNLSEGLIPKKKCFTGITNNILRAAIYKKSPKNKLKLIKN